MAQKVQVLLIDDLDGGEAEETLTFALDGKTYEIDLSAKNGKKLRALLDPYVKAGRKTGGRATTNRPRAAKTGNTGPSTSDIRAWAKDHGYSVNERGRVPANVREAFEKAQAA
ncbi:Lsr2 family protein [Streptomyces sp. NPDC006704]|uniref:histone-like nucleoid-structuring protein Lsr2 n=1 Tax=Streptomyces sp. NPDC006704 TaxID=3364760 RepID=UPI0036A963F1